jgi:hypothetical protein
VLDAREHLLGVQQQGERIGDRLQGGHGSAPVRRVITL